MVREDDNILEAVKLVWMSCVPSKVRIFGWRLLKNRLPMRKVLVDKAIIHVKLESRCVFYCLQIEEVNHMFLNCTIVRKVWEKVHNWVGIASNEGIVCPSHFGKMLANLQGSCALKTAGGDVASNLLVYLESAE